MSGLKANTGLPGAAAVAAIADAIVDACGKAPGLKEWMQEQTKSPVASDPGAAIGNIKNLLQEGFAITAIECEFNQSLGGKPGDITTGDYYAPADDAWRIKIIYQNDTGSGVYSVCEVIKGQPSDVQEEVNLFAGVTGNSCQIKPSTLVTNPSNGSYRGAELFAVEAGSGADYYDAVVDLMDALDATLLDKAQKLRTK